MTRNAELTRLWKVEATRLERDSQLYETKEEAVKAACEMVRIDREKLFSVTEVVGVKLGNNDFGYLFGGDEVEGLGFNSSSDAPLADADYLSCFEIDVINKTGEALSEDALDKIPEIFRHLDRFACFTVEQGKLHIYPYENFYCFCSEKEAEGYEEDCLDTAVSLAYSEMLVERFNGENCKQKFFGGCDCLEIVEFFQSRYDDTFEVIFH